jgi:hypothetical protein
MTLQVPSRVMASPERRNELRYRMLVVLNSTSEPINYHDTVPGVDFFELREAASWLVETGYAVWSGGGVVVTDAGRQLMSSLHSLERRQADT